MEAVPRLPMIFFPRKESTEKSSFEGLKQYIADCYGENPDTFSKEIYDLETLRNKAVRPSEDITGLNIMKRYICQLHSIENRFPLGDENAVLNFSWKELYGGNVWQSPNIKYEICVMLFNVAGLHMQLGASEDRTNPESMKVACTHFQCAGWIYGYIRDTYSALVRHELTGELLALCINVAFGQAQECILEKSLADNRKAQTVTKVTAQIVNYYNSAMAVMLTTVDGESVSDVVGSKAYKSWKRYVKFKICYLSAIMLLYQGIQSEEAKKFGERVTFYNAANEKIEEAKKESKGMDDIDAINEALTFTMDVIEAKKKIAKSENDFIYHEEAPELKNLSAVQGANLVNGISFSFIDPEIFGEDIFHRLVPMKAHESSSIYSEEKANLLRSIGTKVEDKDAELITFVSSLNADAVNINLASLQTDKLPQSLVDRCAALTAKPTAIPDLVSSMSSLAEICIEVESMLADIKAQLQEEEKQEEVFQKTIGQRPPNGHLIELTREFQKYLEAHNKAGESNDTLRKAMGLHVTNLKILSQPLAEIKKTVPTLQSGIDDSALRELKALMMKVDEMKIQRQQLMTDLREALNKDDITAQVIAWGDKKIENLFKKELEKHNKIVNVLEQNMNAQQNILKALTDTYAKCAVVLKAINETKSKRDQFFTSLIASYDIYEDLLGKSSKGLEFYRKLHGNVQKLHSRVKAARDVQDEERQQRLRSSGKMKPNVPSVPTMPSVPLPYSIPQKPTESLHSLPTSTRSGPKLKDYLNSGFSVKGDQIYIPPVRPSPLGSESVSDPRCNNPSTSIGSDYDMKKYQKLDQNYSNYGQPMYPTPNNPNIPYNPTQPQVRSQQQNIPQHSYGSQQVPSNMNSYALQYQQPLPPSVTPQQLPSTQNQQPGYTNPMYQPPHFGQSQMPPSAQSHGQGSMQQNFNSTSTNPYQNLQFNPSQQQINYGNLNQAPQMTTQVQPQQSLQSQLTSQRHMQAHLTPQQQIQAQLAQQAQLNSQQPTLPQVPTQQQMIPQVPMQQQVSPQVPVQQPQLPQQQQQTLPQLPPQQQMQNQFPPQQPIQSSQQPPQSQTQPPFPSQQVTHSPLPSQSQMQSPLPSQPKLEPQSPYTPMNMNQNMQPLNVSTSLSTPAPGLTTPILSIASSGSTSNISQLSDYAVQPKDPMYMGAAGILKDLSAEQQSILQSQMKAYTSQATQLPQSSSDSSKSTQSNLPAQEQGKPANSQPNSTQNSYGSHPGFSFNSQTGNYNYNYGSGYHTANPGTHQYTNTQQNQPSSTTDSSSQGVSGQTFANQYGDNQAKNNTVKPPEVTSINPATNATGTPGTNLSYYNVQYGYQANNISQLNPINTPNPNPNSTAPTSDSMTYMSANRSQSVTNTSSSYSSVSSVGGQQQQQQINPPQHQPKPQPNPNIKSANFDLLSDIDFSLPMATPTLTPTLQPAPLPPALLPQQQDKSKKPDDDTRSVVSTTSIQSNVMPSETSPANQPNRKSSIDSICSGVSSIDQNFDWESASMKNDDLASVISNAKPSVDMSGSGITSEILAKHKDAFDDPKLLKWFHKEVERLERFIETATVKTLNGTTPLDGKWKELQDLLVKDEGKRTVNVAKLFPEKNRSIDSMPYDHARVSLGTLTDDYINAGFVKFDEDKNVDLGAEFPTFIIAQTPLMNTMNDFWRMIWTQKANTVVCLHPPSEILDTYWPQHIDSTLTYGDYDVTLLKQFDLSHCIERSVKVVMHGQETVHTMSLIQIKSWVKNSANHIVNIGQNIITSYEQLNLNKKQLSPLVIHCLNGSDRSGIITVAISTILATQTTKPILINVVDVWYRICSQRRGALRDIEALQLSLQIILANGHSILNKRGIMTSYQMKQVQQQALTEKEDTVVNDPFKDIDPLWKLKG